MTDYIVNAPPKPLSFHGDLKENWECYKQELLNYLSTSQTLLDHQRVFMDTVGSEASKLYYAANLPADNDLASTLTQFEHKFLSMKNIIYERYVFYSRKQKIEESFDTYLEELESLVKTCEFAHDQESLRDQIVLGIADEGVRDRLFKYSGLTLYNAAEICRSSEVNSNGHEVEHSLRRNAMRERNAQSEGTSAIVNNQDGYSTNPRDQVMKSEPVEVFDGGASPDFSIMKTEMFHTSMSSATTPELDYQNYKAQSTLELKRIDEATEAGLALLHTCNICYESFNKKRNLIHHQKNHSEFFQCENCSEKFESKKKFQKHRLTHSARPYECETCYKTFTLKSNWKKHVFLHQKHGYSCHCCNKKFKTKKYLREHSLTHKEKHTTHSNDSKDDSLAISMSLNKEHRSYQCEICSKCFSKKGNLNEHVLTHTGIKPHQCDVCSKSFLKKGNFNQHLLTHRSYRPYQCDVCSKSFLTKQHLKMHMMTHSGERPQQCDICERSFTTKKALKTHLLVHTGERPHQCEICNKRYSQKGSLKMHMFTHTGERPHQCDICSKCFSTKEYFKKHMLTHTGEQPYSCENCGRRFAVKSNLNKHKLIHSNERPHQCDVCSKCFTRKQDLMKHLGVHHRPHHCEVCNKNFSRKERLKKHAIIHTI